MPHGGRDGYGIIGEQRHQYRRQRRYQTGRGEYRAAIKPRAAKHRRLHEDYVSHCREGRYASQGFALNGSAALLKLKVSLQHSWEGSPVFSPSSNDLTITAQVM
jgi:hypothetical protein